MMSDSYKPVSKFYDLFSRVYSLGRIPRCRVALSGEMCAGERVCFVGVGHGVEAVMAAEAGAMVTVVDSSESMLEVFRERLGRCEAEVRERVTVVHDDVRNLVGGYDWVVVNFFLNVFEEVEMLGMLGVLLERCDDGGSLVVGDFCCESEAGLVVRVLQNLNWYFPLVVFRLFMKNGWHGVYDYEVFLKERGWVVREVKKFGVLGVSFYQSVRFVRGCCSGRSS